MKMCFCPLYEIDQDEVLRNSKAPPIFSISNFNQKLIDGFQENLETNLNVISTRTVAAYPKYNKVFNKTRKFVYKDIHCIEIGFINLPLLKYFFEYKSLYKHLKKWCLDNLNEDELYICSYGRRISHAIAINKIKKMFPKVKTAMIFGDLSGKLATITEENNKLAVKCKEKVLDYSIKESLNFDGCIFLTKYMSEVLRNTKPFIVIEGLCNLDDDLEYYQKKSITNKKRIVYTGVISAKYGFDTLIKAMELLSDNYELELYGIGPMVETFKHNRYKNIKYMGYLDADKIKEIQKKADILINPRQNNEDFTKYSFPSKTLEYLVTGNPLIGYKLDGIPSDYDSYINYPKDNSAQELASVIKTVGSFNENDLQIYKARVFNFLKKKSSKEQCKNILEFFKNSL